MCVLAVLLTGSVAPRVANYFAGYRVEALRQERQRLVDENMVLDVEVAKLMRLDRLEELARRRNLVPPKAGQTFDLEPNGDTSSNGSSHAQPLARLVVSAYSGRLSAKRLTSRPAGSYSSTADVSR